jgi:GTP-binding protein
MNIVDLPGYGFARVSPQEKKKWGIMIDEYLTSRENLMQVILLVDSRHKPTADDKVMMNFIRNVCDRAVVVATKFDKLKKSEQETNIMTIIRELQLSGDDIIIPFSTVSGIGRDEFWDYVDCEILNRG